MQVSIQACTEGIIPLSQKTKTLDPRQQGIYNFEVSSSLNIDYEHNCTGNYNVMSGLVRELMVSNILVLLYDNDGNVLDTKVVSFKTMGGCIYCPDGACECEVSYHCLTVTLLIQYLSAMLGNSYP